MKAISNFAVDPNVLDDSELDQINGGMCTYAGLVYSEGAALSNGQVCRKDDTWSPPPPR